MVEKIILRNEPKSIMEEPPKEVKPLTEEFYNFSPMSKSLKEVFYSTNPIFNNYDLWVATPKV